MCLKIVFLDVEMRICQIDKFGQNAIWRFQGLQIGICTGVAEPSAPSVATDQVHRPPQAKQKPHLEWLERGVFSLVKEVFPYDSSVRNWAIWVLVLFWKLYQDKKTSKIDVFVAFDDSSLFWLVSQARGGWATGWATPNPKPATPSRAWVFWSRCISLISITTMMGLLASKTNSEIIVKLLVSLNQDHFTLSFCYDLIFYFWRFFPSDYFDDFFIVIVDRLLILAMSLTIRLTRNFCLLKIFLSLKSSFSLLLLK